MKRHRTKTSQRVSSFTSIPPARIRSGTWSRQRDWIFGAALVAATVFIYQPAWHGKPLLDDTAHFMTAPEQRSLSGLPKLWFQPRTTLQYHPLVDTVYWIEGKLWGEDVLGYHLVTIALHAVGLCCWLSSYGNCKFAEPGWRRLFSLCIRCRSSQWPGWRS